MSRALGGYPAANQGCRQERIRGLLRSLVGSHSICVAPARSSSFELVCLKACRDFTISSKQTSKSGKPGETYESGEQLEVVVEAAVVDDGSHTKRFACICTSREFTTQPTNGISLQLLIAGVMGSPVGRDYIGEIVTTGELLQFGELFAYYDLWADILGASFVEALSDEPFHNRWHRPTVRSCSCREIPH